MHSMGLLPVLSTAPLCYAQHQPPQQCISCIPYFAAHCMMTQHLSASAIWLASLQPFTLPQPCVEAHPAIGLIIKMHKTACVTKM